MLEPEEIKKKARYIFYDYCSLLDEAVKILRSIPRYQRIIVTDKSSGKQHTGVIKKITVWNVEFVEDLTCNCYMFSVENLDLKSINYFGEDQDVQIFVNCFDEIKKPKERKNNAK